MQRLWVRFQQLGCNNYGVLPSTALTVYDTRAEVDPHVALLQNSIINNLITSNLIMPLLLILMIITFNLLFVYEIFINIIFRY